MTKIAAVTIGTILLSAGGWTVSLIGQITNDPTSATYIPAAALTATSGALVWVVKQGMELARLIAEGRFVHRDPAMANEDLRHALAASTAALLASAERERMIWDWVSRGGPRPPRMD
jgi:hypothetical protein